MKPIHFLFLLLGPMASLHANQILLSDDFSGATLDTSKWSTILPYGGSSVVQGGGVVTTTGRGILATANGYSTPYAILGVFTMLNDWEHFNVSFRTDLSTAGPGSALERSGLMVSFSNDGNELSIQRYTSATDWAQLAVKNFALVTGEPYFFSITDTGADITLAVNGVDELTASSTYSTGNHIAFYSREFSSAATSIDAVTVVGVPEVGVTAFYLGLAILGLCLATRQVSLPQSTGACRQSSRSN
jgi:hypothetical protein